MTSTRNDLVQLDYLYVASWSIVVGSQDHVGDAEDHGPGGRRLLTRQRTGPGGPVASSAHAGTIWAGRLMGWTRRHRRGLLVLGLVAFLLVALFVVAVVLTYRTYQHVRGPLFAAQNTLTVLAHNPDSMDSATGRTEDEFHLIAALNDIDEAEKQIDGSTGLKLLGLIPGLHAQRVGLDQSVSDLRSTTLTAGALLRSVNALGVDSHGTDISLPDLAQLGVVLHAAHTQLVADNRSTGGLWGPIGADRQKFDNEDQRAAHLLAQGEELTRYAAPFLGANGSRTYLVAGENNAEIAIRVPPLLLADDHAGRLDHRHRRRHGGQHGAVVAGPRHRHPGPARRPSSESSSRPRPGSRPTPRLTSPSAAGTCRACSPPRPASTWTGSSGSTWWPCRDC